MAKEGASGMGRVEAGARRCAQHAAHRRRKCHLAGDLHHPLHSLAAACPWAPPIHSAAGCIHPITHLARWR